MRASERDEHHSTTVILHLNLPGLPEVSAYQPDPVMDSIARGVAVRLPERGPRYAAFVHMSGGSSDDAVLGVGHTDAEGVAVVDLVENQGPAVPFNPNKAVDRFVATLKRYAVTQVTGDRYAGGVVLLDVPTLEQQLLGLVWRGGKIDQ